MALDYKLQTQSNSYADKVQCRHLVPYLIKIHCVVWWMMQTSGQECTLHYVFVHFSPSAKNTNNFIKINAVFNESD